MLINFPEINNLKEKLGKEEYEKTIKSLRMYERYYSYSNLISDGIIKMQDKPESGIFKKKIDYQNKQLARIAVHLPAINPRIMNAFFILVNNCDLRNISVPKEERWESGKLPSYLVDEKKSF